MVRPEKEILLDIDTFVPRNGEWLPLDALFDELWSIHPSDKAIPVLLRVFDRYPDEDGAGVFWSIVHGIEHTFNGRYEESLKTSAERRPTPFKTIMLGRIENSHDHCT